MADDPRVAPAGASPAETFALMLHDRVVELERQVAALAPPRLDARLTVLGSRDRSDLGYVFVRVRSSAAPDPDAWARACLGALGGRDPTRWDLWCCQHWSLAQDFVTEAVVQRSGDLPVAVAAVGHAALDAALAGAGAGGDGRVAVEACALTCHAWFVESVRAASVTSYAWDPAAGVAIACRDGGGPPAGAAAHDNPAFAAADSRAWTLLHGWLASQADVTDVWHPRALSAAAAAAQLAAALSEGLLG